MLHRVVDLQPLRLCSHKQIGVGSDENQRRYPGSRDALLTAEIVDYEGGGELNSVIRPKLVSPGQVHSSQDNRVGDAKEFVLVLEIIAEVAGHPLGVAER